MLSEAKKRANKKYNEKAYDQLKIMVKKGEREKIKNYAENIGKSLSKYIKDLINEDMQQHREELQKANDEE